MYALYVAPIGAGSDMSQVATGLVKQLQGAGLTVSTFKPLGAQVSVEHASKLLASGGNDQLMEDIIGAYYAAKGDAQVVVIEGIVADFAQFGALAPYAAQLNGELIRNLQADVVFVAAQPDHVQAICTDLAVQNLKVSKAQVIGSVDQTSDVATALNIADIKARATAEREDRFSPPEFRYQLIERARAANKRIVLPEGDEPRTVKAAIICTEKKIARCVLMAKREDVERVAAEQGLTVPAELECMDPALTRANYVAPLVEMRKNKGMTPEKAIEELQDTVMQGTVMMALDEVDGLVSGAVHTTANTVRPALQIIKTAPGSNIVSSVFFMLMPDQVLVYGDCAINPNPNAEQLADIAIQSADSAKAFGIEPRVAMISYSTGTSGAGPEVEKVAQATQLAQTQRPDLAIDGPLQYDAASVESVGKSKAPNSKVAGRATVFVFPDLNTGNCTYKAVQRSANVIAVGPMLQGLRKPVNDLSRGALVDDIVFTVALTAIQAVQKTN